MDYKFELKRFDSNSFIKETYFISPRAEKILMEHNLKESQEFYNKTERFVVDLRIGTVFILDKNKIKSSWCKFLNWDEGSDEYKRCIVLQIDSLSTYNGYITNYQYELAKKICDILNVDDSILLDVIKELPKHIWESSLVFYIPNKDPKYIPHLKRCSLSDYIEFITVSHVGI